MFKILHVDVVDIVNYLITIIIIMQIDMICGGVSCNYCKLFVVVLLTFKLLLLTGFFMNFTDRCTEFTDRCHTFIVCE